MAAKFSLGLQRQELIEKVREKFKQASERYSARYFNVELLEQRIDLLINHKLNIDDFIRSEYEFYNEALKKAETDSEEQKKKEELNQKIDDMISANEEKVKEYPDYFFDPRASVLMRFFTGAINQFWKQWHEMLVYTFKGTMVWHNLNEIFAELERFLFIDEKSIPVMLKHYSEILAKATYQEIETLERQIIQSGGVALFRLQLQLENIFLATPNLSKEEYKFSIYSQKKLYDNYNKKNKLTVLQNCKENSAKILEDFRITSMVEHGYTQKYIDES